jgi:hypothetical protein
MEMKKIAAIITAYYPFSHADVIISKFLKGFPTDSQLEEPQVEIVSFYLDQIHPRDVGVELAKQFDIPIFGSITQALTLDGSELAVDGVLLIGEHGEYAWNEKGQHLYPRRHFFEQICGVIAAAGRSVPVFSDKHLAWNWDSAKWMVDRAKTLGVPFMAGSSLPVSYRNPGLEYELETPVTEAVSMAYGGLDSYGFHALETLQCMVERRPGGETGIRRVQCLEGDAVWEAGQAGRWSQDLFDAAAHHIENREYGDPRQLCQTPALYLMEYADGLQTATFMLADYLQGWGYAGRVEGEVEGTEFYLHGDPHPHFSYLCLNAQQMFLSGEVTYPVERTLLITGALEALLDSRHRGHVAVDTPHLDVRYTSYTQAPLRPEGARPTGAALVPCRPQE